MQFVSGCVLQPEDKKDDSSDEPTAEVHNSITVVNIPKGSFLSV